MSKKYKYQFTAIRPTDKEGHTVLYSATRYSRRDAIDYLRGKGIKTSDLPKEREEYMLHGNDFLEFKKIAWGE